MLHKELLEQLAMQCLDKVKLQFARSRRVAQLVSALPSVLEVTSSILSDSNVCSYLSLICVAVALNARKMEH